MISKKLPFDLILFDLGGVLVINQGPSRIAKWLATETLLATILDQWLHSASVRAFESGQINAPDFAARLIKEFAIPVSADEFLDDFKHWANQLYPGAEDLLKQLRPNYTLGCLSNTNAIHWQVLSTEMKVDSLFDTTLLSYEIGLLKPDLAIVQYIIEQTGLAPERILFFDDHQRNINSAKSIGIAAYKTEGVVDVLNILEQLS